MIANDLISAEISPLHLDDSGEQALTMMSIYHVKHLPLVDENQAFLGLLSEDIIIQNGIQHQVSQLQNSLTSAFVYKEDHLFDVLAKIAEYNLTALPVLDKEEKFVGIISQDELLQFYANSFSFTEPGSIIVLEMSDNEYSLSEISRIVELENASILSSFLTKVEGKNASMVTLKINKKDINGLIAAFERYEYDVKASFMEDNYIEDLKERYDSLMHFLNV